MSAPIVFLDTETTGVHPGRKVWEIAMIRRDEKGVCESQSFVDIDLSEADPFGLKIGGFYDRHPQGRHLSGLPEDGGETLSELGLARWVARCTHGAHIVGAVPNFDTEVLAATLRAHGLLPAWHYHLVDIENLAVGYMAGKGRVVPPPWKSDALTEALGVEMPSEEDRHTALGDARWAMRVYDRVMGIA